MKYYAWKQDTLPHGWFIGGYFKFDDGFFHTQLWASLLETKNRTSEDSDPIFPGPKMTLTLSLQILGLNFSYF